MDLRGALYETSRTLYGVAEVGWWTTRLLGSISLQVAATTIDRVADRLPGEPLHERLPLEVPVDDARRINDALRKLSEDRELAAQLAAMAVRAVKVAKDTPGIPSDVRRELASRVADGVEMIVCQEVEIPLEVNDIDRLQVLAGRTPPASL